MKQQHFQIAIIGSGFAGSLMAMIARRLGYSTVLIERGRHPRFVIGESSTPLTSLLLEEIAVEYDLPFVRPLCKWGPWQNQLPEIGCGLKRGFTFYHHDFGKPFASSTAGENQLLIPASPNDEVADTHWYRADFDHYLMEQAWKLGATYLDETALSETCEQNQGMLLTGSRHGEPLEIFAEFVIDASGPRGFLHRSLKLPEKVPAHFPPTQGLFSHFKNVGPLPKSFSIPGQTPPYPPENAAVHHVFPGGWIWVLKFNNGITSAGVAATDAVADELNFKEGEPAWQRLLKRLPSVAEIFRPARATVPFVHSPRLSFQSPMTTGRHWALLPSAAGFVDPLLSTGFPLTLLGVQRLAAMLRLGLGNVGFLERLRDHAELTTLELETSARLIGALYANMNRFDSFKELCLLYFVAARYSETARRLDRPELENGFLVCRHATFAPMLRSVCALAGETSSAEELRGLIQKARHILAPVNSTA